MLFLNESKGGKMPKGIFEIECLFKLTETNFVPFLLQIKKDNVIISARIRENEEPHPGAMGVVKAIDGFLHQFATHNYSEECIRPERVSIFELYPKK